MSQLRLDPLTGRWVAINAERRQRPNEFASRTVTVEPEGGRPCPFCPGQAESEPPMLVTPGPDGSWQVLVVPNRYPAFEGRDPMVVEHLGPISPRPMPRVAMRFSSSTPITRRRGPISPMIKLAW
jgi:UDPglucose--hexose-1-phosphate uridylyltransferase